MTAPAGSGPADGVVVAAFDLDGTLTTGHSTVDFVRRLIGWPNVIRCAARASVKAGLPPSRSAWKEAAIGEMLRDRSEAEVRSEATDFAVELLEHRLIADTAGRLSAHLGAGHEVVLVSAALDVYVEPVARLLGATSAIATKVEMIEGRCTGRLIDADLHDERKVERLKSWLGRREPTATVYAYGNSEDDDEMQTYAAQTKGRASSVSSGSDEGTAA